MKRTKASTRRASACVGVAFSFLCGIFVGSPALAYDDEATITSVLGLIGVPTEGGNEKIDYRDRSKLVLPPGRQALPEPQARGDTRPAAWPVEQGAARRRSAQAAARQLGPQQPGQNQDPAPAEVAEQSAETPSSLPKGTKCLVATGSDCLILTDADEPTARANKTRDAGQASARTYLTEPPAGYRQPVKGGKSTEDASEEKAGWFNPAGYLHQQASRILGGGQ